MNTASEFHKLAFWVHGLFGQTKGCDCVRIGVGGVISQAAQRADFSVPCQPPKQAVENRGSGTGDGKCVEVDGRGELPLKADHRFAFGADFASLRRDAFRHLEYEGFPEFGFRESVESPLGRRVEGL